MIDEHKCAPAELYGIHMEFDNNILQNIKSNDVILIKNYKIRLLL